MKRGDVAPGAADVRRDAPASRRPPRARARPRGGRDAARERPGQRGQRQRERRARRSRRRRTARRRSPAMRSIVAARCCCSGWSGAAVVVERPALRHAGGQHRGVLARAVHEHGRRRAPPAADERRRAPARRAASPAGCAGRARRGPRQRGSRRTPSTWCSGSPECEAAASASSSSRLGVAELDHARRPASSLFDDRGKIGEVDVAAGEQHRAVGVQHDQRAAVDDPRRSRCGRPRRGRPG